jgi:hypothetical protein
MDCGWNELEKRMKYTVYVESHYNTVVNLLKFGVASSDKNLRCTDKLDFPEH